MPIKLSELVEERAELVIPVLDDSVKIVYKPGVITPAVAREHRKEMEAQSGSDSPEYEASVINFFLELVVEWDLMDDDGSRLPLEFDVLADKVPLPFIALATQLMMEDVQPGETNSETSAAGYRARANSARNRNGIRSLERQGTSGRSRGSFSK